MNITKLIILISASHFLLVIILFLCFGLGLEGKHSVGHLFLWTLMLPAVYIKGPGLIVIPLNSFVWGLGGALLLKGIHRIIAK